MRASHLCLWALQAVRDIIDAHEARFGELPSVLEIDAYRIARAEAKRARRRTLCDEIKPGGELHDRYGPNARFEP